MPLSSSATSGAAGKSCSKLSSSRSTCLLSQVLLQSLEDRPLRALAEAERPRDGAGHQARIG